MIARIVLLVSLALLVAAPPAEVAEAAPDPLAVALVLVEEGATPLADELAVAPHAAGAAGGAAGGARPSFAGEAIPPGPPLARIDRPPRSSLR